MATNKEHPENDEVNKGKEFQKRVDLKSTVIDFLKETLESVTDSVFKKAGFKKNTKNAGEYGNGSKYGAGAVENQYIITIAGKTNSSLTKKVVMDGKSISSDIEIVYKNNVVDFVYKTTEQGFFRGVNKDKKSYMVNERFSLDSSDITNFKKELKNKLESFSEREYGFISNTKLGVADKSDKSTSSVVENTTKMKKLTIKELYEMDFESDSDFENSDRIKDLNTLDLKDTNPSIDSDKKLFFDDAALNETNTDFTNVLHQIESATDGIFKVISAEDGQVSIAGKTYDVSTVGDGYDNEYELFIADFPIVNADANYTGNETGKSGFAGDYQHIVDVVMEMQTNVPGFDFSINEITTAGPAIADSPGGYKDGAQSGAGGYNTPQAWKKTNYAKNKQKRPKVTKDYKIVAQEEENKMDSETESTKSTSKSEIKSEQPSNKNNGVEAPKTDQDFNLKNNNQNWKDTNQTKAPKTDNDGFWTEVELNPGSGYVPKGMEQNYIAGMHNASASDLKGKGYAEGENKSGDILNENVNDENKSNLTKRKFFSLNENKEKGINKRYLITEKTSDEYEKERWSKLSSFKSRESIKEAEEMTNFFDSLEETKDPAKTFIFKRALTENVTYDDIFDEPKSEKKPSPVNEGVNSEETIEVEKPGSKFGLTYKFFKKDFIQENKMFILDLNSKVYVKNPNAK